MNIHHAVSYIEFGAKDLTATKAFYTAVFGWEFTDYGPDYAAFKDPGGNEGGFSINAEMGEGPLVILYSSELEKTKTAVEQNGGKIMRDIFSFPGGQRFHFADPNGNELAVWSE
jgi:predicted enzyme related to lactoylglutathione lyase